MKTTYYLHNPDTLVISSEWSLYNLSFTSTLSFLSASISIVPNPLNNLLPSPRQHSQKPAKARVYLCNTYALSKSVLCNKTVSLFERSEIAQLGNSPRTTAQVQYYHNRCCYDSVFTQILWGRWMLTHALVMSWVMKPAESAGMSLIHFSRPCQLLPRWRGHKVSLRAQTQSRVESVQLSLSTVYVCICMCILFYPK